MTTFTEVILTGQGEGWGGVKRDKVSRAAIFVSFQHVV